MIRLLSSGDNIYKLAKENEIDPYKIYYLQNNIEYRAKYPSSALVPVGTMLDIPTDYFPILMGGMPIQAECLCSKVLTLEAAKEIPACCPYTIFVGSYLINGMTYKGYSSFHNRIRFCVTDENDNMLNAIPRIDYIHVETTPLAVTIFPKTQHINSTIKIYADIISAKKEAVVEIQVVDSQLYKYDMIACVHKKAGVISRASWGATGPWVERGWGRSDRELPQEHWGYNTITIHHSGNTESDTPQDIEEKQKSDYVEIAYHFMIDKNGKIFEGRPLKYKGDHAYPNSHKIGILLIGDFSEAGELDALCPNAGFGETWADNRDTDYNQEMSADQKESLKLLCSVLIACLKIEHLGGHREHTTFCRACPGNIAMTVVDELRKEFNLPV